MRILWPKKKIFPHLAVPYFLFVACANGIDLMIGQGFPNLDPHIGNPPHPLATR